MTYIVNSTTGTPATPPNPAMGEVYMTANTVATPITTADTYTKVSGVAFTLGTSQNFDMPVNGRLRYTGTKTAYFHLGCTLSMSGAGANDVFSGVLYKNGTVNTNLEYTAGTELSAGTITRKMGAASDAGSTAIHVMTQLSTNDYIELAIKNETDTDDITIEHVNLFGVCMMSPPSGYQKISIPTSGTTGFVGYWQ